MRQPLYQGNGFVELVDIMGDQQRIVEAARVSYAARTKGPVKDRQLIHFLMRHRHHGPLEHVVVTFRVRAPIYVARQHMRHRTWSYNEVSRRYSTADLGFYVPITDDDVRDEMEHSVRASRHSYSNHIHSGVAPEKARSVLTVSEMTEYVATTDLRNFLHFVDLRLSPHAQEEIRELALAMYQLVFDKQNGLEWVHEAYHLYGMRGADGLLALAMQLILPTLTKMQRESIIKLLEDRHKYVGADAMLDKTIDAVFSGVLRGE